MAANLLHMEEIAFPCKMYFPILVMMNLSMPFHLLSLPIPFCPSRAEKQLTDTRGGTRPSSFHVLCFLKKYPISCCFQSPLLYSLFAPTEIRVSMSIENCLLQKASFHGTLALLPKDTVCQSTHSHPAWLWEEERRSLNTAATVNISVC